LETKYGVPAVAIHTEKFDKVVKSVAKMGGLPQAALVFVPQPVMGKTEEELRAYVEGSDPITGKPVMQEVIEALTQGLPAAADAQFDRASTPRLVEPDTEDALHATFLRNNWTDKLPIILPTKKKGAEMPAATSRKPVEDVGHMQPTTNRGLWEYTGDK